METTRNSYFGGPLIFAAEFVNAFYRISEDREKQIVILTGGRRGIHPEDRLLLIRQFRAAH
jgi:hypothetical protein